MQTNLSSISIPYRKGFPKSEYAFCDGALSAVVERYGGIAEISLVKIWEERGTPFPDQQPMRILRRQGLKINHPGEFYGPPLRFISTQRQGPNAYHFPQRVNILPFGFESTSNQYGYQLGYRLCLFKQHITLAFQNDCPQRKDLVVVFYPDSLYQGKFTAVTKDTVSFVPVSANPNAFEMWMSWKPAVFDRRHGLIIARGTIHGRPGRENLFFAIGSDGRGVSFEQKGLNRLLRIPWKQDRTSLHVFLVIESSEEQLSKRMAELRRDPEKPWHTQVARYRSFGRKIPRLRVPKMPAVENFYQMAPLFEESMLLLNDGDFACRRGACHKYGYWWQWDSHYPVLGMMSFCDPASSIRIFKYVADHAIRSNGWNLPGCLLAVLAIYDCMAATRDPKRLKKLFPRIKATVLRLLEHGTDRGMLTDTGGTGCDDPAQVGIRGKVLAPDQNGLWYSVLRLTENTARWLGDISFAAQMRQVSENLRRQYLQTFYDAEAGYLVVSADPSTGRKNQTFQNTVTMAMDGLYGPNLFLPRINPLARFIENELTHPSLRVSIPYWSPAAEMWHSCIMMQHAAHESRTLRFAGRGDELMRYFRRLMDWFEETGVGAETFNCYDLLNYQVTQDRDWQAFGARARYAAIMQSLLGLELDWGGITYIPCDTPVDAMLSNLHWASVQWDIQLRGKGAWVKWLRVNGESVKGTLKVPHRFIVNGRRCHLVIEREDAFPRDITLYRAPWLGVEPVAIGRRKSSFDLLGCARTPVWILSRNPVTAFLDGKKIAGAFHREQCVAEFEVEVNGQARLEVYV